MSEPIYPCIENYLIEADRYIRMALETIDEDHPKFKEISKIRVDLKHCISDVCFGSKEDK